MNVKINKENVSMPRLRTVRTPSTFRLFNGIFCYFALPIHKLKDWVTKKGHPVSSWYMNVQRIKYFFGFMSFLVLFRNCPMCWFRICDISVLHAVIRNFVHLKKKMFCPRIWEEDIDYYPIIERHVLSLSRSYEEKNFCCVGCWIHLSNNHGSEVLYIRYD